MNPPNWFYVIEDRGALNFVPVSRYRSRAWAERRKSILQRRYRRRAFVVMDLDQDLELHPNCLQG